MECRKISLSIVFPLGVYDVNRRFGVSRALLRFLAGPAGMAKARKLYFWPRALALAHGLLILH